MSVLKMVLGFLVGAIACAILLALISIRSPILASSDSLATRKVAEAVVVPLESGEQNVNKQGETAVLPDAVPAEPTPNESDAAQNGTSDNGGEEPEVPVIQELSEPEPTTPDVIIAKPASVAPRPSAEPLGSGGSRLALGAGSSRLPSMSSSGSGSRLILDSERDDAVTTETEPKAEQPSTAFALNANQSVDLDQPLISFLLLDVGTQGVSQSELLRQTMPIAFAVDGSRSDAGRVSGDYRDAGFEVVAMVSQADVDALIDGAGSNGWLDQTQTRTVLQSYLTAMPDALALLDAPSAKLQKNRRFFGPVFETLAVGGQGVLSYKGGISSAGAAAKAAGLKFGLVSKYIGETEKNMDATVRVINRAALEAAQDGAAIIMAVATPENLDAIKTWGGSSAATKVTIAPLSSSMQKLSR